MFSLPTRHILKLGQDHLVSLFDAQGTPLASLFDLQGPLLFSVVCLKGLLHPKMKILSLITYPPCCYKPKKALLIFGTQFKILS